ncbi:MAG: hypothetical protein HKL84_05665 [Acidimicrobiaceae bacterium]|nr:hypothetical protein [Acidimicrobiaceae bacterium]
MSGVHRPVPRPSPETVPFWEACQQERFLLPRCSQCGSFWFPPTAFCPECWSPNWDWHEATGLGSLHSFVIFRRQYHPAFVTPYAVGVVHLKEGPNILGRILTNDFEKLHVEMPLTLMWDRAEEWVIPAFQSF